MLGKKVDSHTAFPSLYPEFSNKHQTDLSMEVTMSVKLGFSSLVVVKYGEHSPRLDSQGGLHMKLVWFAFSSPMYSSMHYKLHSPLASYL